MDVLLCNDRGSLPGADMRWIHFACALLLLPSCLPNVPKTQGGEFSGKLNLIWVDNSRFIYEPDPVNPLTFKRRNGVPITPGRMYTDGGSIPPIFWPTEGLRPWTFGPAYIVHDWLFEQRRCKYEGYENYEFWMTYQIMAEAIDTLQEDNKINVPADARDLIIKAVSSSFSRKLWNSGTCDPPPDERAMRKARAASRGLVISIDYDDL